MFTTGYGNWIHRLQICLFFAACQECMDCLESCGIRATGKQMPGLPRVPLSARKRICWVVLSQSRWSMMVYACLCLFWSHKIWVELPKFECVFLACDMSCAKPTCWMVDHFFDPLEAPPSARSHKNSSFHRRRMSLAWLVDPRGFRQEIIPKLVEEFDEDGGFPQVLNELHVEHVAIEMGELFVDHWLVGLTIVNHSLWQTSIA